MFAQNLGINRTIDGVEYRLLTIEQWGQVAQMAIELDHLREENESLQLSIGKRIDLWKLTEQQYGQCREYSGRLALDVGVLQSRLETSAKRVSRLRLWSYVPWVAMAIGGVVVSSMALSN